MRVRNRCKFTAKSACNPCSGGCTTLAVSIATTATLSRTSTATRWKSTRISSGLGTSLRRRALLASSSYGHHSERRRSTTSMAPTTVMPQRPAAQRTCDNSPRSLSAWSSRKRCAHCTAQCLVRSMHIGCSTPLQSVDCPTYRKLFVVALATPKKTLLQCCCNINAP